MSSFVTPFFVSLFLTHLIDATSDHEKVVSAGQRPAFWVIHTPVFDPVGGGKLVSGDSTPPKKDESSTSPGSSDAGDACPPPAGRQVTLNVVMHGQQA